jgi:porin
VFESNSIFGRRAHILTFVETFSCARLVEEKGLPLRGYIAVARRARSARAISPGTRVRCVVALLLSALPMPVAMAQSDVPAAPPTAVQGAPVSSEQAPTSTGISARSYLTGDWGGVRSTLAEHGMILDLRHTGNYQGLLSGTGDEEFNYGGKLDAFVNFDSGKLGLWQGGGLRTHLEYRYGDAPANLGGVLFSENAAQLWPIGAPEELVATSLYLTQKLGDRTSIVLGKVNPIDLLAADPFFGGWGIDRFMNLIFVAPPSGLVPPVFMGVVANIRSEPVSWTLMVFDPDNRTNDYFPGDLFSNGVNVSLTATTPATLAGRSTSYAVTANYSTAEGTDYATLPPDITTSTKQGSYNIAFQFTHNLQETGGRSGASWGFYLKAAVADGNPNYVKASLIAGIGGRALFFERPQDSFGLGFFYYDLSDELQDSTDPSVNFHDESAIEAYYNWAITPWLLLGADIQYINPARGDNDRALVGAIRMQIRF